MVNLQVFFADANKNRYVDREKIGLRGQWKLSVCRGNQNIFDWLQSDDVL